MKSLVWCGRPLAYDRKRNVVAVAPRAAGQLCADGQGALAGRAERYADGPDPVSYTHLYVLVTVDMVIRPLQAVNA